jgi:hypothetical protein
MIRDVYTGSGIPDQDLFHIGSGSRIQVSEKRWVPDPISRSATLAIGT